MKINVKLLKKEFVANNTMAFYLEKPANFEFIAGQFCEFNLINPTQADEEGNNRAFSLVSAPYEENLLIATRMRNTAFKNTLKSLTIGDEIKLEGPYGDYKLHKTNTKPAVFIIGGIGITPVRSIIAQATRDHLPHKITLFYSNKTPLDAAFTTDFEIFAKNNPNFTFIPIYTDYTEKKWEGEHQRINSDILKKYVTDIYSPIYYLSGPAEMVKSMREMLVSININEDNIKTEEFSGY